MSIIDLKGFLGEQPRIIPRLMAAMAAQSAVNCRLDDGSLSPLRVPNDIFGFAVPPLTGILTIYLFGAQWIAWNTVVHAAPGPVATDRLYYTGDGVPRMRVGATIYDLKIPPPTPALTATLGGVGAGDVVSRFYVYTWVTGYGEESEPTVASNTVAWQPGNTVTLSGFIAAPGGRNITLQRIYRLQTGPAGSDLYFIAERAATNANYVDSIAIDAFGEVLPSRNWTPPVDTLKGLTAGPNGMMAAFLGKTLYFSEPYHPHAWPAIYALLTDYDIVGLGWIGTTLVIMTTGNPYIAVGSSPETMQMEKLEANFPCINGRGIVDLGYAIAYPSNEGLITVRGNGAVDMVTEQIFNREDWLLLSPATMVAGQISGRYVASFRSTDESNNPYVGCVIFDLAGQSPFLIRTDSEADAFFYEIGTGALYFLQHDTATVRRFDPPDGPRAEQHWKSKEFVIPKQENFGVIRIDARLALSPVEIDALNVLIAAILAANAVLIAAGSIGGELGAAYVGETTIGGDLLAEVPTPASSTLTVNIYGDKVLRATVGDLNVVARLPAGYLARVWEVEVFGDVEVDQITMAGSVEELQRAAA